MYLFIEEDEPIKDVKSRSLGVDSSFLYLDNWPLGAQLCVQAISRITMQANPSDFLYGKPGIVPCQKPFRYPQQNLNLASPMLAKQMFRNQSQECPTFVKFLFCENSFLKLSLVPPAASPPRRLPPGIGGMVDTFSKHIAFLTGIR